jgi:hypothetical protein
LKPGIETKRGAMRRSSTPLRRIWARVPLLLALLVVSGVIVSSAGAALDVSYTLTGTAGENGWYRSNVRIVWVVTDGMATQGCVSTTVLSDTNGSTQTCQATDNTTTVTKQVTIRIDRVAPQVTTASPQRAPDANGWYNHPVAFTFSGSDGGSGIAGCSQATYGGPDNASAAVGGSCRDRAGNVGSNSFRLRYDATPPALSKVGVTSKNAVAVLRWQSTSPADTITVRRSARANKAQSMLFRGAGSTFDDKKIQRGLEYVYTVQSTDQAGNVSKPVTAVALPKVLTLRKTPYTPRAAANPMLRWQAIRGASYYHVQLFRGSKRILAAWPLRPTLDLPTTWRWAGHRYRLGPGRYRWYVWEGLGQRSFARYKTVGHASFIVPRR